MRRPMLYLSLLTVGAFGTTALSYWYLVRGTTSEPQIARAEIPKGFQISPERVDFGTMIQGQTASRNVTIFNGTPESWIIDQVVPSCGCGAGEVSSQSLPTLTQISLQVYFDSAGKFGDQKHAVRLLIHSVENPQRQEQIQVTLTAEVKAIISADVEVVTFPECNLDGNLTERFTLYCAEGHAGTELPRLIEADGANLGEFELLPRGPLKEGLNEIELKFSPKQAAGRRVVKLHIDPGLFNHPPVAIRVDASVPSEFQVAPADVSFGTLRPDEPRTIRLRITAGKAPFAIDRIPEYLKVTLAGVADNQELIVEILPEKLKPSTILKDQIRLKTGSVGEPFLYISVLGLVTGHATVGHSTR